ncbi:MAG: D-2-hydroxyacid dehydrogenase [Oscillospiraceae bacterium]|jgi:phosphoglycerate dehydrogenase-like enzyme
MEAVKKVLVVFPMDAPQREQLSAAFPELEFCFAGASEVTKEQVHAADVIFGNPSPNLIRGTKKLKWIQLNSAGTDGYTADGVLPDGALLTNATGAYGLTISEHLLGMLLMLYKKLYSYRDAQLEHHWTDAGSVKTVVGSTVLILGAGNIGTEFAKRVKAMGATTIGVRRTPGDVPDCYDEMHFMEDLDDLLPRADVISMSLPGTPATTHIINRERIARMKEDAVILNVGRGSAIDLEALCDAMEAGKLWGVGLDVTEPEPLPADHRLWGMKNAVITPHAAGGFHLEQTVEFITGIFTRNLKQLLKGGELENMVDFATGYRKK